jgi:hypothetical protein
MSIPLTGGCLCGGIRYEYEAAPLGLLYCHCKDCQRCTGGPFAAVALIMRDQLKITQGQTRSYTVTGEEGGRVYREFCPTCGSPLFSGLEASRKMMGLKAGSLDDSSSLTPLMHIWTDSAVKWLGVHDELPRLPRNPPRAPKKDKAKENEHA